MATPKNAITASTMISSHFNILFITPNLNDLMYSNIHQGTSNIHAKQETDMN